MSIALLGEDSLEFSDSPTFEQLVESHIPLVRSVVGRLRTRLPSHVDLADLFSVGITGLISAASNYSHERAKTFGGYAAQRIRGAILDELRKSDTRPRRARLKGRQIAEVTSTLEQKFGRPVTSEEIRAELGLTQRQFAKWTLVSRPANFVSLDELRATEASGGVTMHDAIEDESISAASENVERAEMHALLVDRINSLPERQQKILALYYHEAMRFSEIAEVYGISESRVCQIHGQAVAALRAQFSNELAR